MYCEYEKNEEGRACYRRVYIVYHDGHEVGLFFTYEAVSAFIEGFVFVGGLDYDLSVCVYLQPLEHARFLEECLHAKTARELGIECFRNRVNLHKRGARDK